MVALNVSKTQILPPSLNLQKSYKNFFENTQNKPLFVFNILGDSFLGIITLLLFQSKLLRGEVL